MVTQYHQSDHTCGQTQDWFSKLDIRLLLSCSTRYVNYTLCLNPCSYHILMDSHMGRLRSLYYNACNYEQGPHPIRERLNTHTTHIHTPHTHTHTSHTYRHTHTHTHTHIHTHHTHTHTHTYTHTQAGTTSLPLPQSQSMRKR